MEISTSEKLIDLVKNEINKTDKDIFSIRFDDEKYWIKKARATHLSKIHKIFYTFLPLDLLATAKEKTPQENLFFERTKINNLAQKGINVPNVIYYDDDFIILEDTGVNLHEYFKNESLSSDDFKSLIYKSIYQLALLHNQNLYHGGNQTRNFTLKDGKVYLIDFEENFKENIPIETLKFRDFLLFLTSIAKLKNKNYTYIYIYIYI